MAASTFWRAACTLAMLPADFDGSSVNAVALSPRSLRKFKSALKRSLSSEASCATSEKVPARLTERHNSLPTKPASARLMVRKNPTSILRMLKDIWRPSLAGGEDAANYRSFV